MVVNALLNGMFRNCIKLNICDAVNKIIETYLKFEIRDLSGQCFMFCNANLLLVKQESCN